VVGCGASAREIVHSRRRLGRVGRPHNLVVRQRMWSHRTLLALRAGVLVFAAVFWGATPLTSATPSCRPTPISLKEAQNLLLRLPDAVIARGAGGKVDVLPYRPPDADPAVYYFSVWTDASQPPIALDNGLLGYFEVDSRSVRVVDVAGADVIGGDPFERYRHQLRSEHCIAAN